LSKKVRFGVFKRDSFTCQYCGAAAPNVQLHIDHITPVSDGGGDDPDNLVTACAACNFGKGARTLDDDELSAPSGQGSPDRGRPPDLAGPADRAKQSDRAGEDDGPGDEAAGFASRQEQARAIEERRSQLDMMIEWREEIVGLQDEAVDALDRRIVARTGLSMSEEYRQRMRRWVRQHGLATIFEALEDAFDQMLEWQDDVVTIASWERAFAAIPQVIEMRQAARDKPHFRELVYICGLLRRRLQYVNELRCLRLMEDGVQAGASIEAMKAFARTVKSWTAFRRGLEEYIDDYGRSGHDLAATPSTGPPIQDGDVVRADLPNVAENGERALPPGGPPGSDRLAMTEAPFEKRRPLRHFSAERPPDAAGRGGHEMASAGRRPRSG
jgi:HNH endonuclease